MPSKFEHGTWLPDLNTFSIKVRDIKSYSFSFSDCEWAIFTINDETGEFLISSDWGNYSYKWSTNPQHLGAPTLTDFLRITCQKDPDYICRKFTPNSKNLEKVIDEKATIRAFKNHLGKLWATKEIRDKELLKAAAKELSSFNCSSYEDWSFSEQGLYALGDIFDGEDPEDIYDLLRHKPSPAYQFFKYRLLPFFGAYLETQVGEKDGTR